MIKEILGLFENIVLTIICEDVRWNIPQNFESLKNYTYETVSFKPQTEVNLVLGNNALVHSLNKQYRGKDQPTDVLSFPLFEPLELQEIWKDAKKNVILGDIVLGLEFIQAEAKVFEDHVYHLFVHGLLHLLGYDHMNDDEAEIMESLETHILQHFNISNPYL